MRRLVSLLLVLSLLPGYLHAQAGDGRIYVRRIEFQGTDRINDDVLRRELTQVEGAVINTTELERSRLRLEQLPFVDRARIEREPVAGAPDQVDLVITITDAPARRYGVGGAYSESLGLSGYGFFLNNNLLGTGQRLFAKLEKSEFFTAAQLSHTDPFTGANRISRTVSIMSRRFDQLTADTTELNGDLLKGQLEFGYRIAERQAMRLGLALQDAELTTGQLASTQLEDWVQNNGNPVVGGDVSSTDYLLGEFLFGWHHDTRDGGAFPTSGLEQQINAKLAVPGSEVEYYSLEYTLSKYWSLNPDWTLRFVTKLGYGAKYGSSTTSLPPNLNWFAGGPNTVRGFRENRLGPRDSLGNPYGGNLLLAGQLELMAPVPEKWQERLRIGLFYDVGNVFSTESVSFVDDAGQPLDYGFDLSELRQSVGISAHIRLPIGLVRLSYGIALNANESENPFLRDDTERVQVAIGVGF